MQLAPRVRPSATDPAGVARDRVRFLTAEPVAPGSVRESILASWWRTRSFEVPADRLEVPFVADLDLEVPLVRSADPVLRTLADQMSGQAVSIVLTDSAGTVLRQLTGDATLAAHLDRVRLAPGFSYAERHAGTNGIGTALEGGGPMHVFGHEHYAENLEDLACAAVPIHHPVTGKTVGALDLTCWYREAGPLLGTLAATTAEQIRQALLADTGLREIELLHEYLRTCRRTGGIVFAVNPDVAMMNDYGRTLLDPADQAAVLRQAGELLDPRRPVDLDLPSGARARLHGRSVTSGGRRAGVVVHVRLLEHAPDASGAVDLGTGSRMLLPGLVGSDPVWRRACDDVARVRASRDWLAVEGEAGVGKTALLKALHQRHDPSHRQAVVDAAGPGRAWFDEVLVALEDAQGSVVVRHVDRADAALLRSLRHALQDVAAREMSPWVAVTVASRPAAGPGGADAPDDPGTAELRRVLQLFPRSVEVPALRHHAEDLRRLVPFLLGRLGCGGRLTCSPETMTVLMRSTWPGNVTEVLDVLRSVVQHRRTGVVQPGDLPPGIRTVSKRLLSPLESLERDAIIRSLVDAGGSKGQAARALGMSRATMYRRIREYGIVAPEG